MHNFHSFTFVTYSAKIYLFKVDNNRNTKKGMKYVQSQQ